MTIKSSLMFAKSLIFPKTEKKSSARRSLFGAIICIGLSIIPLIVVISITDGMIDGMTERIIGLSSNNIQVYVSPNINEVKTLNSFIDYGDSISIVKGVEKVYPEINIAALAVGKKIRSGIEIRGISSNMFETNNSFKKLFSVIEGDLNDFSNSNELKQAVIGKKLAEELKLKVGDSFRIITTKSIAGKITPKLSTFTVSAVVSSGYQELDQFWVFVPLESCYKNLSLESATFNYMIQTSDSFSPDLVRIQRDIRKYVGRYANVYRWDEIHSSEFENFSSTKVMLVFVMILIVLVASVNISSAIIMLVMERQKEIAILKSLGATPNGITFSFLIAALSCAIGGLLLGIPLGIVISLFSNQILTGLELIINFFTVLLNGSSIKLMDPAFYLEEIPIEIFPRKIVLIAIAVLLLSMIVSFLPAKKAGKEKPLEILRKG